MENSKESTDKLLGLIGEFTKVSIVGQCWVLEVSCFFCVLAIPDRKQNLRDKP